MSVIAGAVIGGLAGLLAGGAVQATNGPTHSRSKGAVIGGIMLCAVFGGAAGAGTAYMMEPPEAPAPGSRAFIHSNEGGQFDARRSGLRLVSLSMLT